MAYLDITTLPDLIESEQQLDELMSTPSKGVVDTFRDITGDVLVLGVGGKMGTHLAVMAHRAAEAAGGNARIIGVSRFSTPGTREKLESYGVSTIACDLLDEKAVAQLPDSRHIVFMAGRKFGTGGSEETTWAMNTLLPAIVARRYAGSRIVAFSTGNVYPLSPVTGGGAVETQAVDPIGEYAITTLGRERVFQYYSKNDGTEVALIRLNYAIDLRYGVLHDIGQRVFRGEPIDITMGNANVIWQGDAVAHTLMAFTMCAAPPRILNVTGPETMSMRWAAERFGEIFDTAPVVTGEEGGRALISNAAVAIDHFGYPLVPLRRMITWTAHWIRTGGPTIDKPTHFETYDGKY